MQIRSSGHEDPRPSRFQGGASRTAGPVWRLHLVRHGPGEVLRLNGEPLVIYTRDATEGLAALLGGRDPRQWRAEVSRVAARAI